ncbi:MAG: sigma-70 family RNA polymerase sigma factor [Actinomycetota bacterium]
MLDEDDIASFLGTTYPRLVNATALVCGNRASAEDAVQEALARAWERSRGGLEIESLEAWVTTVALNLARSALRRRLAEGRARRRMVFGHSSPGIEDRVALRGALALLTPRQREVAVLRYYLDLDVAEVAARIGVTEGTVKTLLHRARLTLGAALGISEE